VRQSHFSATVWTGFNRRTCNSPWRRNRGSGGSTNQGPELLRAWIWATH